MIVNLNVLALEGGGGGVAGLTKLGDVNSFYDIIIKAIEKLEELETS